MGIVIVIVVVMIVLVMVPVTHLVKTSMSKEEVGWSSI